MTAYPPMNSDNITSGSKIVFFSKDFRRLFMVCMKMLFRKSTRKRFAFLVLSFLFIIGFNSHSYIKKYHMTEIQKREILDEKAFKVFFLRFKTAGDLNSFLQNHMKELHDYGAFIMEDQFIYQNNLYIPFYSPDQSNVGRYTDDAPVIRLFYHLFGINEIAEKYSLKETQARSSRKVKNIYINHNGNLVDEKTLTERHRNLQRDLFDIAYMLRDNMTGKRIDVYNLIADSIISNIKMIPPSDGHAVNPYFSRVECVIPVNVINILAGINIDNATDIIELGGSIRSEGDMITVPEPYLNTPEEHAAGPVFKGLNIYPRYLPLVTLDILKPDWNWMLYQDIRLKKDLMGYLNKLHSKGHYMYSYEKQYIMKEKVEKINREIRFNHIQFYLTDLSMGIVFPFIISLFAFIYLKGELAFILMYKNRIREILAVFWLMPVSLMIMVKAILLSTHLIYYSSLNIYIPAFVIVPLGITVLIDSMLFIPVNRYCFSPFTGNLLSLYNLNRG